MCSDQSDTALPVPGFPIRTSTDRSLVGSSPWLIAATHVLLRLQAPRHPPLALCSLENKDARARSEILKGRAERQEADTRWASALSRKEGVVLLQNGTEEPGGPSLAGQEAEACN
jgi:hypothetical protein